MFHECGCQLDLFYFHMRLIIVEEWKSVSNDVKAKGNVMVPRIWLLLLFGICVIFKMLC